MSTGSAKSTAMNWTEVLRSSASGNHRERARDRLVEHRAIAAPRNFHRAKTFQMLGHVLGVEQLEAACDQPRHQMHQTYFRGVAGGVKHALAEKSAAEAHAVEPADQVVVLPDLDAVAMPERVQPDI